MLSGLHIELPALPDSSCRATSAKGMTTESPAAVKERKALQVTSLSGLMKLDHLMRPMTTRESLFLHSAWTAVGLCFTIGRCSLLYAT